MKKLHEINLAFADIETTGLDLETHEIIEIAVLAYNPNTDEIKEWETKIAPSHIETASDVALRINGYTNNPKSYATNLKSAMIKFNSLTEGCIIVGQNINFDLSFIKKAMKELGISPNFDRRSLDLMSLVWFAVKDTGIPGISLEKLCNYFGVCNVGAHTAMVDCRRTFEIYRKLAKPKA